MPPETLSALRLRSIIRQNSRSAHRKFGYVHLREIDGKMWATDLYFCAPADRLAPMFAKDGIEIAEGSYRVDGKVQVAPPGELSTDEPPIARLLTTEKDLRIYEKPFSLAGCPVFIHRPSVDDTLVLFRNHLAIRFDHVEMVVGPDWESALDHIRFSVDAENPLSAPVWIYRTELETDDEGISHFVVTKGAVAPVAV